MSAPLPDPQELSGRPRAPARTLVIPMYREAARITHAVDALAAWHPSVDTELILASSEARPSRRAS